MTEQPTFKEPEQAFIEAIEAGRLSASPHCDNYAGDYMYMATWADGDSFKHVDTRRYLPKTSSSKKQK